MSKKISDIQFGGTNNDFVWKSSIEDFANGSMVTVYESQEAVFYYNGACVGVLGPGIHILETVKIPFLKRIISKIVGAQTIFHAQIYFVNKVELDMKWGAFDIQYTDPAGPVFKIGCRGQLNLKADVPRQIVEKLVGNAKGYTKDQVMDKFHDLISAEVSDRLVNTMMENRVSITQLSGKLLEISKALTPIISELFFAYGFSLERFRIVGVVLPEKDPEYERLKKFHANKGLMAQEEYLEQQKALIRQQTEAEKIKMEAQALAYKRQVEGYDYETQKRYEFLNKMAENGGSGTGISSDMLQLGAGLGMLGAVGNAVGNAMGNMQSHASVISNMTQMSQEQPGKTAQTSPLNQPNTSTSEGIVESANINNSENMGSESGVTQETGDQSAFVEKKTKSPREILKELKELYEDGLIEKEEYDAKRAEVMSRF